MDSRDVQYESCQGLLVNWQKSFGLGLITSDELHANIGIFTNICNGACRILWGLLFDRIGYRKCFLIIGTFVSIGVTSLPLLKYLGETDDRKIHNFYLTPSLEVNSTEVKILWSVLMVILYCMIPGIFAVSQHNKVDHSQLETLF